MKDKKRKNKHTSGFGTRIPSILLTLVILTAALASCADTGGQSDDSGKPLIYASFFPVFAYADYLIGEEAEVRNLLPISGAAHDWEPDPRTAAELEKADLLILNGLQMETWADKLAPQLEDAGVEIIKLGDLVLETDADHDHSHDHSHDDDHSHADNPGGETELNHAARELQKSLHGYHDHEHAADPHIWLDPLMAAAQVDALSEKLGELFPDHAARYDERKISFREEAEKLDEEMHQAFEDGGRSVFIVTHEAFSFLADSYGLIQVGVTGIMTEQEPDPRAMAQVINFINLYEIPTIYQDAYGSSKIADAVVAETDAEVRTLYTMEAVSDEDYSGEDTYFDLMRRNLDALKLR